MELYSGVYNIVRSIGWVDWNSYIWTYNDLIRSEEKVGLGVCCID